MNAVTMFNVSSTAAVYVDLYTVTPLLGIFP